MGAQLTKDTSYIISHLFALSSSLLMFSFSSRIRSVSWTSRSRSAEKPPSASITTEIPFLRPRPVFERFARVLLNPLSASPWPLNKGFWKKRKLQTVAAWCLAISFGWLAEKVSKQYRSFGFIIWKLRNKKANSTSLPPWTCRPRSSSSQSLSTKIDLDLNWPMGWWSCHITPWAPNTGRLSLAMRLFLGRSAVLWGTSSICDEEHMKNYPYLHPSSLDFTNHLFLCCYGLRHLFIVYIFFYIIFYCKNQT